MAMKWDQYKAQNVATGYQPVAILLFNFNFALFGMHVQNVKNQRFIFALRTNGRNLIISVTISEGKNYFLKYETKALEYH